eukprot:TCONS_00049137-protein
MNVGEIFHSHLGYMKRKAVMLQIVEDSTDEEMSPINTEDQKELDDFLVYTDPDHSSHFFQKLYDLYTRCELCDITLRVNDETIPAHKIVLASNSLYFEGMFLSNLMESSQNDVVIKEIDFNVLKSLVDFCYTSVIKIHSSNVFELLSAANMLQFDGIKKCCSKFLEGKLEPSNCLTIASFADLHTCHDLKDSAIEFSKKHFRQVIQSEDFISIPFDQIKTLLQSDVISVTSEIDIFHAIVTWIGADEVGRMSFFNDLFRLVRFLDLSPKVLVDIIEPHQYVQNNVECIKLLSDIKTSFLLPQTHTLKQYQPRCLQLPSMIYLIGGETKRQVYDTIECYCLSEDRWRTHPRMSTPRDGLAASTYDGKIFVAGGYDGTQSLNTCEFYDPVVEQWQPYHSMSVPRHAFSMAELNGWLYVAGGSDFVNTEYNSVERYDPIRDVWETVASMTNKREGLSLVSHDRILYAMGGENGISILNTVEMYDPRSGVWNNCCPMGYRRRYFGAAILDNRLYSVGGSDYDEDLNTVEIFEPRTNRWYPIPSMKRRRESVAVVAIDGKLYALGGACINRELDSVEVFDPIANQWEESGKIPTCKEGMAAVIL